MLPPSANLAIRLKRGWANQPDPAFPQSPGNILGTFGCNLLIAAARPSSFNELESAYQLGGIEQGTLTHSLFTARRL